jgi:hypothetical protein
VNENTVIELGDKLYDAIQGRPVTITQQGMRPARDPLSLERRRPF